MQELEETLNRIKIEKASRIDNRSRNIKYKGTEGKNWLLMLINQTSISRRFPKALQAQLNGSTSIKKWHKTDIYVVLVLYC